MKERKYIAYFKRTESFRDGFSYYSSHKANSTANKEDLISAIQAKHGHYYSRDFILTHIESIIIDITD